MKITVASVQDETQLGILTWNFVEPDRFVFNFVGGKWGRGEWGMESIITC